MKTKPTIRVWCVILGIIVSGCTGKDELRVAEVVPRWTEWSNGLRMRVAPTKPVFGANEAPSFSVEFEADKVIDVSIPYLVPSGTNSVIGPFTVLEVWVSNTRTGDRYHDDLSRLSGGRSFALVPEGSSLERISPTRNATSTFLLKGPFMPARTVETLREAREKNLSIALDLLPKSLTRLPWGRYTLSLRIEPRPSDDRTLYRREAMQNPPKEYRNVWTGILSVSDVAFEIAEGKGTAEPTLPAGAEKPRH